MKLNIFRGALFRFCNEKGVFTDKHGCVIDVTDRVTYYRWEKGSFVVEDCSIEQFDKYRISFGIPYDLELKAKVTGFKQSASLYGMRQRKEAFMYALPLKLYEQHHIRRYGFHGISHSYVMKEAAFALEKQVEKINLITLHLGNGASVCAIQNGKSIDTSMGFTPLEGLMMGSRSGDVDPALVLYMQRELGVSVEEVDDILNKKSGLIGICDENDVRKIINRDDERAKLALAMMIRRIQKYIGSYMAILGRVDAIVFTGGIGENSAYIREKVLDTEMFKNIKSLVIKTDEELEIANECVEILKRKNSAK